MIPVKIRDEVLDFIRTLPPEPRHKLKTAIKALGEEHGNIRALTDDLARRGLRPSEELPQRGTKMHKIFRVF